ncbi:Cro/Cl family transcriptional regulator [Aeromonas veronii]|uniref:Cro/Cl family transcriptional regulator n=1 Tax=Aeromonas veronii TaxID=654 RepID=UPI003B9F60AA
MLKHSLLALTLIAGAAQAAVENGSLNFNWQGTTPADAVVPASWKFTDAVGGDYTPTTSALNMSVGGNGVLEINSAANHSFFITATTGTLNSVDAYLGTNPVSSGFVASKQLALATSATPADDQVAILMNNQPLKVGAANKIPVGGTGAQRSVDISLAAKAAASTFAEKSVIGFSVPVIFAVDIT